MNHSSTGVASLIRTYAAWCGINYILLPEHVFFAAVAFWFAPWALALAAGTVLITFNFWSLAKFGQHLAYMRKGAVVSLLIRFYGRLILSGLALYGLIVFGECSIYALLAGLSTVVVNAIFWGVAGLRQKVKEA